MTQFTLQDHPSKVATFNPRAEKHGEENVPAGDIKIETRVHSSILDSFDKSYRPFLFRKADLEGEQQALLAGDKLTSLSKPKLRPLALDEKFPGYTVVLGNGLETSEPMTLTDCTLAHFRFEAINGGSVAIAFSITCHPDEQQAGRLSHLIQNTVELTLVPPSATEQKQMELAGPGDTLDQQEAAEAAARASGAGDEEE